MLVQVKPTLEHQAFDEKAMARVSSRHRSSASSHPGRTKLSLSMTTAHGIERRRRPMLRASDCVRKRSSKTKETRSPCCFLQDSRSDAGAPPRTALKRILQLGDYTDDLNTIVPIGVLVSIDSSSNHRWFL